MGFAEIFGKTKKSFVEQYQLIRERQKKNKATMFETDDPIDERSPYSTVAIGKPEGRIGIDASQDTMSDKDIAKSNMMLRTGRVNSATLAERATTGIKKMINESKVTATNLGSGTALQDRTGRVIASAGKQAAAVAEAIDAPEEAQAAETIEPENEMTFDNVPEEYQEPFRLAMQHLNRFTDGTDVEPEGREYEPFSPKQISGLIAAEGNWNPDAGNPDIDFGMTQINASKQEDLNNPKTIWGKSWKNNFSKTYGKFNPSDETHQILGASVILAAARQRLFDAYKNGEISQKPTQEQILAAYNMEVPQVIDVINGEDYSIPITFNDGSVEEKSIQQQYKDYTEHLRNKGVFD